MNKMPKPFQKLASRTALALFVALGALFPLGQSCLAAPHADKFLAVPRGIDTSLAAAGKAVVADAKAPSVPPPAITPSIISPITSESGNAVPPAPTSQQPETAYVFSFAGLLGGEVKLDDYAGRPMLIVNTASKCGFTPQYEGLEKLWNAYKDKGLVVIGIPSNDFGGQEPGDAADIKKFCDLTYGVSFPMTAKQVVKGKDAHPFYQWAKASYGGSAVPKWNFHKILIGVDGTVVDTWSSMTGPSSNDIKKAVERELAKSTPAGTVEEE